MSEFVRILSVNGDTLQVKGGELGGCFGCMNHECAANGNCFSARNVSGQILVPGDFAEVALQQRASGAQAAAVLGIPAVVFIAVYWLLGVVFPLWGDPPKAAAALLGLVLTATGIYMAKKKAPVSYMAEAFRKVSPEEYSAAFAEQAARKAAEQA